VPLAILGAVVAPSASAEPLAGLADCPDCNTESGGGAVVDFFQELNQGGSTGIQDADPAGANYVPQASSMLADLEAEPIGSVAGEAGGTTAGAVAQQTVGAVAKTFVGALEDYPPLFAVYGVAHLAGADPISGWAKLGSLIWHGLFGTPNATPSTKFNGYYEYADQAYYTNEWFAISQGTGVEGNPPGTAQWNHDPACVAAATQGTIGVCTVLLFGNANGAYDPNWDEGSQGAPSGSNIRWWWGGRGMWQDSIDVSNAQLAEQSVVSIGAETPPPGITPTQANPATEPSRSQLAQNLDNALQNDALAQQWLEHELNPRCNPDPASTTVTVPTILDGETVSDYQQCLTSLGLQSTVAPLQHTDLDQPDGDVVFASPDEGAQVSPGTEVTVEPNPTKPDMQQNEQCRPTDTPPAGAPASAASPFEDFTGSGFAGSPYTGIDPTTSPPTSGFPVHLYWGVLVGSTGGWGYRHIAAKRGYGLTDEQQTILALQGPLYYQDGGTTWVFDYPYTVASGGASVACARRVVVQYARAPQDPAPKHIITSFYGSPVSN
jgi:hypothetical protein